MFNKNIHAALLLLRNSSMPDSVQFRYNIRDWTRHPS
jgi:hypothetical protein